MKPRQLKLNAHRTLEYYTPEDVAAMLEDAERYRWLRDNCVRRWRSNMPHNKGAQTLDFEFDGKGHDPDAAIDAAMKDSKP